MRASLGFVDGAVRDSGAQVPAPCTLAPGRVSGWASAVS